MKAYMKSGVAVLLAAMAVCLCGCNEGNSRPTGGSISSIVINSSNDAANGGSGSTSNGSSGVTGNSSSTVSDVSEPDNLTVNADKTVASGETLTVKSGETLYINSGAELTVEGKIDCENGGSINIQSGGALLLGGDIRLDGDLKLNGKLGIRESGKIAGSGTLSVLDSFEDIDCEGTCTAKIKAPAPVEKDGITTVGGVLIVNKKYTVPEDYGDGLVIDDAYNKLLEMREDTGYSLALVSGFRSYETQKGLFEYYCEIDDYERVIMYSAEPGHSEHQTGLAMDLGEITEDYAYTEEGAWLTDNCHKYGFIIRYPMDGTDKTGYDYEPWHVRYLGKSTAKLVVDSGLTLEEFLGVETQ